MASYYMMTIVLFTAVNAMLMIAGFVGFVIACILTNNLFGFRIVAGPALVTPSIVLITSASIVLIFGVIGSIGCWKENRHCLISYFTIMVTIFIVLMVTTMASFICSYQLAMSIYSSMRNSVPFSHIDFNVQRAWDILQRKYSCCGVDNYKDWIIHGIPESCCEVPGRNCTIRRSSSDPINQEALFPIGCYGSIQRELGTTLNQVGFSAIAIAVFQIFCIMSSLALFCYLQRRTAGGSPNKL